MFDYLFDDELAAIDKTAANLKDFTEDKKRAIYRYKKDKAKGKDADIPIGVTDWDLQFFDSLPKRQQKPRTWYRNAWRRTVARWHNVKPTSKDVFLVFVGAAASGFFCWFFVWLLGN